MKHSTTIIKHSFSTGLKLFFKHIVSVFIIALLLTALTTTLLVVPALLSRYLHVAFISLLGLLTFPLIILIPAGLKRLVVRYLFDLYSHGKSSLESLKKESDPDKAFRFGGLFGFTFVGSQAYIPLYQKLTNYAQDYNLIFLAPLVVILLMYFFSRIQCAIYAMVDQNINIDQSLSTSWRITGNYQLLSLMFVICVASIFFGLNYVVPFSSELKVESFVDLSLLPSTIGILLAHNLWTIFVMLCSIPFYKQLASAQSHK